MKILQNIRKFFVAFLLVAGMSANAQTAPRPFIDSVKYKVVRIRPDVTDPSIHNANMDHVLYYDPALKKNKILLWLTGTGGTTANVPAEFFNTALSRGYRIVALSFITDPGVSQVCKGNTLDENTDCAADFRRKRIYGDNNFSLIPDDPQDAIIPRFIKLLQWLAKNDPAGNWSQYLTVKNAPKLVWNKIAVAGQSQGGGMAEFIGQHESAARIISFSGGWDYSNSNEKKIAGWYYNKPVTQSKYWFATYHVQEAAASTLSEICKALRIPANHVFALNEPLFNSNKKGKDNNPYHGEGIRNIGYRNLWIKMLGSGY